MSRSAFLHRADAAYPFQNWQPFPSGAIVQVKNQYGVSRIDMKANGEPSKQLMNLSFIASIELYEGSPEQAAGMEHKP
jgi:hypothetical protein